MPNSENLANKNRRRSDRIDARIKVQFRSGKEFSACYSQNLSKGGIYLETADLPDPNALIELDMELPGSPQNPTPTTISITGKIVRLMTVSIDKKTIHKVAIQFVNLPAHIQLQINKLYEELSTGG